MGFFNLEFLRKWLKETDIFSILKKKIWKLNERIKELNVGINKMILIKAFIEKANKIE